MNWLNKAGTDIRLRYKLLAILLGIFGGLAAAAIIDWYFRRKEREFYSCNK